jgi:hypothetical protein
VPSSAATALSAGISALTRSVSPPFNSGSSHATKPGTGDSVQNTLRRGHSRESTSTTFLMRKFPSDTPRSPGWQLLIE